MGGTDKPFLRFISEAIFTTIATDKRRVAAATPCRPFLYAVVPGLERVAKPRSEMGQAQFAPRLAQIEPIPSGLTTLDRYTLRREYRIGAAAKAANSMAHVAGSGTPLAAEGSVNDASPQLSSTRSSSF